MSLLSPLASHEYAFHRSVAGRIWRWKVRVDVSGASPAYTVRDIVTPVGRLLDSIPIPGEIIQEMAASINKVKEEFAPTIEVGASEILFVVDEGRGFSAQEDLVVTNAGIFGSLLDATLVPSADFITITPGSLSGLASGESGISKVMVNSSELEPGTYDEVIVVRDDTATNNPATVQVGITVRPKARITVAPTTLTFEAERSVGGTFPDVDPKTFTVTNDGPNGSKLAYYIQRLYGNSCWLEAITPMEGELDSGDSQVVTITVKPTENMLRGTYEEMLRVSGYSENSYADVLLRLVVS